MHIDIQVAWVTLRLSTIQKVIYYHDSPKYIISFPHSASNLSCAIQNIYRDLKQATDTPGDSVRVWELSRVGRHVACFPPLVLLFVLVPLGASGTGELQHYLSRGISSDRCKDILQGGKQFVCGCISWLQHSGWRWCLLFRWTSFHEKAVDWLRVT